MSVYWKQFLVPDVYSLKDTTNAMSLEFEKDSFLSLKRLSANNHYYTQVFKRAERIASVVFYVLSYIPAAEQSQVHHTNLSDKAMRLHEAAIASLNLHEYEAADNLHDLMQALVALESTLHIASAARVITADIDRVIGEEIDTLQRMLRNHYLKTTGETAEYEPLPQSNTPARSSAPAPAPTESTPRAPAPARKKRPAAPKGDMSSQAASVYSTGPGRLERIKTVLEAKGEASIKDIADVITDCSEKTIQRDLNSLIDSGDVIRHGERRWSRYTMAQS